MVVIVKGQRLKLRPGIVAALIVGGAAALVALFLPDWRLARLVIDSGLPSILPPAEPPLGWTARLLLVLVAGGGAAGATWAVAQRILPSGPKAPTLRAADAHPDAPFREPVKAMRDLGAPFMDVGAAPAEQDLPRDLDMPMAGFDPAAVPDEPMTPSEAVAPLYRPVIEMVPPQLPEPETVEADADRPNINALLDRLERGVRQCGGRPMASDFPYGRDLDEALATLQRFTTTH